jgi:hypothetical protein
MWPFSKRQSDVEAVMRSLANKRPDLLKATPTKGEKPTSVLDVGLATLVIVQLRESKAEELSAWLAKVFDVVQAKNALVESVMSSLVLIITELPLSNPPTSGEAVAIALQRELGDRARIVYGTRRCARGIVSAGSISRHLSLFETFGDCIRIVEELQFGEVRALA